MDGAEPKLLLRARSNVTYAGGHLLFLRDQKLVAQRFDPRSLELKGDAVPIASDVRYEKGFFSAVFAASDTMLVFQSGGNETKAHLRWMNRKGETIGKFAEPEVFWDVAIAPDGKTAAICVGDPCDIWLYDLTRGIRNRFTFDPWQEQSPIWSPDSKTLLYWSDREVQVDTFRKSLGSSEMLLLGDKTVHEKPLDWSRDGRYIIFSRQGAGGQAAHDLWSTDRSSVQILEAEELGHAPSLISTTAIVEMGACLVR